MKKLIPLIDYVEETRKHSLVSPFDYEQMDCDIKELYQIYEYANFLKQKPELWMLVPCDDEGNVLEMPIKDFSESEADPELIYQNELKEYQKAKERVLFKGFEYSNEYGLTYKDDEFYFREGILFQETFDIDAITYRTIEDLTHLELELT